MAEPAGHAGHDPMRVAQALDRGARLAPVMALCARCAGLYADLVALTAALPRAALPARHRAFTLSPEDARRLRLRGWRAWWSTVGSARDTITRPLAIGFSTLGLAGLLLTVAPGLLPMAGTAAGPDATVPRDLAAAPPEVLASGTPGAAASAPVHGPVIAEVVSAEVAAGPPSATALSVGLLVVAGGLFAVRRVAVRGRAVR